MRFKQICNHPAQWLGDGAMRPATAASSRAWRRSAEDDLLPPGEGARLHPVSRDDRAAGALSGGGLRAARAGPARGRRRCRSGGTGRRVPGATTGPLLRPLAQGGRHRTQPHRRHPRHSLRPLVESGGGEPGHRPGFPHRPEAERPGAQARLPGHDRGAHRRHDRGEAGPVADCWRAAARCGSPSSTTGSSSGWCRWTCEARRRIRDREEDRWATVLRFRPIRIRGGAPQARRAEAGAAAEEGT